MRFMKDDVKILFERYYEFAEPSFYSRAMTAVYLFDFLDRMRMLNFPETWFSMLQEELEQFNDFQHFQKASFDLSQNSFDGYSDTPAQDVEARTGKVYYKLWKHFTKEEYFKQTAMYLKERFEKNSIDVSGVENALDDGCGGGRYTLSLKALGCRNVTGIDISPDSIEFAEKMNPFPTSEVNFTQGSVLELPFPSGTFDFVFSNGVLHHTVSTEKGLQEIYRVMKNGGFCWLYLYGGKDSFFWDVVDFCRKLLAEVPQKYTQELMNVLGYPPGRIFHRLDFFYVPINRRYFPSEVEEMLMASGFSDYKRLNRGAAHDWDEIINNNPNIDPYIYGDGEIRYQLFK